MESPCTNHAYPIKHLYKDCELLKRFLRQAGGPKEGKGKEAVAKNGAWRARIRTTEGPYTATEVIQPDAYQLKDDNGNVLTNTWKNEQLCRFFPKKFSLTIVYLTFAPIKAP